VPFLLSVVLVGDLVFIRLRLRESPLFASMKASGRTSPTPVAESFGTWSKWQTILTVLWGAAAGQAVVWYTGQFYALSWLQNQGGLTNSAPVLERLGLDQDRFVDAYVIIAVALAWPPPSSSSSGRSPTGSDGSR
jgi:hypothetical protein